jgi:hypothetical protein
MCVVKTWRSIRVRSYVLPLLLGALALRFLIPAGFMPGAGDGIALQVTMCSTTKGKSENIEVPRAPTQPHCDQCMSPSLGSPLAPFNIAGPPHIAQRSFLPQLESQISETPLARSQIARAPPPRA